MRRTPMAPALGPALPPLPSRMWHSTQFQARLVCPPMNQRKYRPRSSGWSGSHSNIFTAPTAVRMLMKYGSEPARKYDLGSLTRIVCACEVLNAPAWEWLQLDVLKNQVPVLDHMWQTETGGPIFGNPWGLGMLPIKPGSGCIALPGVDAAVVSPEGEELGPDEKGMMVIKRPFPGLTATLWGEVERYATDYWRRIPGKTLYLSGDASSFDEDGYVWFSGRVDEISRSRGTAWARSRSKRRSSATRAWPRPASRLAPIRCAWR